MNYADLDEAAKEAARQWYKDAEAETWGSDRAPDYYEDMATCLGFLGITVETESRVVTYQNGAKRTLEEWQFEWSGFWSQGDGLVFTGDWSAANVDMNAMSEYVQDPVLQEMAIEFMALMLRHPTAHAQITTVSNGPGLPYFSLDAFSGDDAEGEGICMADEDAAVLKRLIERAAHWCYRQLEANYEYDTSDEAAVEAIEANEYEFDEEGERITRRERMAA